MVFQNASKYEVVVFLLNENVFFFFDVLLLKISLKKHLPEIGTHVLP